MRIKNEQILLAMPTQLLRIALNWSRDQRRLLAAAMDGALCVIAVWIAYSLRLGVWELVSRPVLTFAVATLLFWYRSEERLVGKKCGSKCRSWWSAEP